MQKMRFFRRCLPLFLAFWLLLAVAGAPFAAYAGESVTVRDSSGQVRYVAPMDPENACPALQSALDTVRSGAYGTCTVTVTPGEYRMTKSAVLASDMTLNLTGVTLLNANACKGNIFISPNRDRTGKDYTGYSALKNCTLRGGTLDYAPGNTNGSCLLRLAHCKNVTVDGTAFLNNTDSHHAELAAGYNVRFVNCLFSGQTNQTESSAEALQIDILEKNRHFANFPAYDGTMNQKITVEDCTFQDLICGVGTRNAFSGRYQKGITIRGNTFRRLQGTAIVCTNYVDTVIEKNTITDCGRGVAYYMCKNSGVTDVFTDGSGKVLGKRNTDCGSRITDNTISVCQTAEMDKPRGMFLYGGKATGKNVLAENLAAAFGRPAWDISFHVNMDAASLIGMDTFAGGQVVFRPGPVYRCAQCGGFGVLDEINMAKNEALAVLHAVLDFRRAIDVPGYDRIPLAEETRFIATMNYGYAGTRELNEALTSRFAVVQMPTITQDNLEKLLRAQFPDLTAKYVHQFALLFLDLQKKCDSAEISTKALDLRGMLDALRLIRRGIPAGAALDMGITNKAFDSYEQGLIRDVIAARIPAKLDAGKLFA